MDIISAINSHRLIEFSYDGHYRKVIPAAYGNQTSTRNKVLRAYQIGGTSSTRTIPLWDLFLVNKISDLTVLDETFSELPPYYKKGDKHINPIEAEL